jgi:hypothetical protein
MRTRQKRTLVDEKEIQQLRSDIRKIIEDTGMKYVLIPNGIFDDFYTNKDKQFTELDMTVYIFLQFMMVNKFTLNYKKFADYIGCSSKQLKEVLKRLQQFKGKTNAVYYSYEDKVKITDETEVSLISEKTHSAYNPKTMKNQKTLHWYTNYIPYYKAQKKEVVPFNFFMVTLEDFDLLTEGKLTRNEFITYLFFLKAYKYGSADEHQMWWKLSTITETLNYKLVKSLHKHMGKILSLKINEVPLLEEIRPKNYDLQILKGEEPSSRYIPRFNTSKMMEMNFGKVEMNSLNEEVNSEIQEVNFENKEMSFQKEEVSFTNEEMDSPEWEMTFS